MSEYESYYHKRLSLLPPEIVERALTDVLVNQAVRAFTADDSTVESFLARLVLVLSDFHQRTTDFLETQRNESLSPQYIKMPFHLPK